MDTSKKTIFMTVSVGMIARNLLQNKFWEKLKDTHNVVILTPVYDDKQFTEEFQDANIIFVPLVHHKLTWGERVMKAIHKALIYNQTVRLKAFYGFSRKHKQPRTLVKVFKNYSELIFFGFLFSKLTFLRDWAKAFDRFLFRAEYYTDIFRRYNPDLVFVTNMSSDDEVYVVRSARKQGIPVFGMTKSWDNFSKVSFRDTADQMIVWSDFMKDEVMRFQNYPASHIAVTGIPQFDLYSEIRRTHTKKDFKNTYGLDPNKETILFGQCHPDVSVDDPYIVSILKHWIIKNDLPYQILIRPHFGHPDAIATFNGLADKKTVFVDDQVSPSQFGGGRWDFSKDHHIRLALSMVFADVVITSSTTLVLDALASGNRVICYAFDKNKHTLYGDSIQRFYDTVWFEDLRAHGLDKSFVYDEQELCTRVKEELDENITHPEYEQIIKRFCYKADGKSGIRIYKCLTQERTQ